jgi:hypothetical protein
MANPVNAAAIAPPRRKMTAFGDMAFSSVLRPGGSVAQVFAS